MIVGITLMIFYMLKFKFGIFDGGKDAVEGLKSAWWRGISPEGFGTVAMLANFIVAIAVSAITPAPPTHVQQIVEDIRIPRGAGEAHAH
jgi:cation/acetate symporter